MGEVEGVGFPAGFEQLLVDDDAGEVFRQVEMAAGLLRLMQYLLSGLGFGLQLLLQGFEAALVFGAQLGERGFMGGGLFLVTARLGIHLLGEHGVFLGLAFEQRRKLLIAFHLLAGLVQLCLELFDLALQLAQRRAGVAGHHEGAGLEVAAGLAESLVIPDAEGTGDLEAVEGFAVLGAELVGGLVAFDAQGVEQAADAAVQLDFTTELVEQVGLGGLLVELDASATSQILSQGFAKLAQFDQGGVGIGGEDLLGGAGELQEQGIVFLEEVEVTAGGHWSSLNSLVVRRTLPVAWRAWPGDCWQFAGKQSCLPGQLCLR